MKIEMLAAMNFKGRTFDHRPGAVAIFHGENGAGKSAVIEALRLGLLGYDPRFPKTKAGIWDAFASDDTMNVQVSFKDGVQNKIELVSRKGSVSGAIAINREIPPFLLDMNAYWSKSRADRAQFLMSQCVPANMQAALKALESEVSKLEAAISGDNSRREVLKGAIASQVAAPGEIRILELPSDHGQKIADVKKTIREGEEIIQGLTREKIAASAVQQRIAGLNESQRRATETAPTPICEHCGNPVNALKDAVAMTFQQPLIDAHKEAKKHRSLQEIEDNFEEWNRYLTTARASLQEMETAQSAWNQHIAKEQSALRNQKELEELEPRIVKNREALKDRVEKRKLMLAQCVDPLLAVANSFLVPVLDMRLELENGHLGFKVGEGGRFLPFGSLSGAQELMASAGLQLAMSAGSPVKIVVMDELGRLSSETKVKLVAAIKSLLEKGTIEQFFGCDVSSSGYGGLGSKAFHHVA